MAASNHNTCEGGGHTGAALSMLGAGGASEHVGSHLIHAFLAAFSKAQLLQLEAELGRRAPVRLPQFIAAVRRVCPMIRLTETDTRRASLSHSANQEAQEREQDAMLAELFDQLDGDDDQIVTWSDVSTLLFSTSACERTKHKLLTYAEIPQEPRFPYHPPHKAGRATAQLLSSVASSRVDETLLMGSEESALSLGPLGRKVGGAGLYWEDVERLKYFPGLRLYCLTGGQSAFLFSIEPEGAKGAITAKLTGPTAAIFNMYHFQGMRRMLGCCADRYLYTWVDSQVNKRAATERVKVGTPQLCAAYDAAHALLLTGGTDGAILICPTEPRLSHAIKKVPPPDSGPAAGPPAQGEWMSDMLLIPELAQLVTCSSDGRITLWDTGWDEFARTVTDMRVRSQKEGQGRGVRTQVAYANKYRMLMSVGAGHDITCWNPFIVSHTHYLRGHDKVLTQVHAFETSPEVISADVSGRVIIWDIRTLGAVQSVGGPDSRFPIGPVSSFAFNVHTSQIVTVGKRLCAYNSVAKHSPRALDAKVTHMLFAPGQKSLIASCGSRVFVFHAGTGDLRAVFHNITRSDITCMVFSLNRKEIFVGSMEGELRIVTMPNGTWHQELTAGDAVVAVHPIPQPFRQAQRALAQRKIAADKDSKKTEDPHLLLTIAQSGAISLWYWGKMGDEAELFAWRSMLDQLTVTAFSASSCSVLVASKNRAEVWNVPTQQVRRTFRCSSPVTSACFSDELHCLALAERAGVIHFYATSGFAYLLRISFAGDFAPFQLDFLSGRKQLACVAESGVKVLSMRNILERFHSHNDAKQWLAGIGDLGGTAALRDRYITPTAVADSGPQTALDIKTGRCVLLRAHSERPRSEAEAAVHRAVQAADGCPLVRLLDSFSAEDASGRPQYCNVFESWEGRLPNLLKAVAVPKPDAQRDLARPSAGADERQWVLRCAVDALRGLHAAGIVALFNPWHLVRDRNAWKLCDMTHCVAMDGGASGVGSNPPDLTAIPWPCCPPELAQLKWEEEIRARGRRRISRRSVAEGLPVAPPAPAAQRKSLARRTGGDEEALKANPAWDLWGLGLVVWMLYAGRPLWEEPGEDEDVDKIASALMGKHAKQSIGLPPRTKDMPSDMQEDLVIREVVENLLVLSPAKRWTLDMVANHLIENKIGQRRPDIIRPFPTQHAVGKGPPRSPAPGSSGHGTPALCRSPTSGICGQFMRSDVVLDLAEAGPFQLPAQHGEPHPELSAEERQALADSGWYGAGAEELRADDRVYCSFVCYEVTPQVHNSVTCAVPSPEPCPAVFLAEWDNVDDAQGGKPKAAAQSGATPLAAISAANLGTSRLPMSLGHLPLRSTLQEVGLPTDMGGSRWMLGRLMAMAQAGGNLRGAKPQSAGTMRKKRASVGSAGSKSTRASSPAARRKRGRAVATVEVKGDAEPPASEALSPKTAEKWHALIAELGRQRTSVAVDMEGDAELREKQEREEQQQQQQQELEQRLQEQQMRYEQEAAESERATPQSPTRKKADEPPPVDPTEHLTPFFTTIRTCVGSTPIETPFYMERHRPRSDSRNITRRRPLRSPRQQQQPEAAESSRKSRDEQAIQELGKGRRKLGLEFLMKETRPARISHEDQERLLADVSRELSAVALAQQITDPEAHVDSTLFLRQRRAAPSPTPGSAGAATPRHETATERSKRLGTVGVSYRRSRAFQATSVKAKMLSLERMEEDATHALQNTGSGGGEGGGLCASPPGSFGQPVRQTLRALLAITDSELRERRREKTLRRVASICVDRSAESTGIPRRSASTTEMSAQARRISTLVTGTMTAFAEEEARGALGRVPPSQTPGPAILRRATVVDEGGSMRRATGTFGRRQSTVVINTPLHRRLS
eukprot:TRINITY_DN11917_c2_g2_i2.p1 TRINITY_DN11917_c2_g2~~TRINITY_DN11917_c2_g2_i2.p1  ORF type:complete len:1872 (+),score=493.67 TRINITY_DN11917_c2_g2_i2:78-5693(+)